MESLSVPRLEDIPLDEGEEVLLPWIAVEWVVVRDSTGGEAPAVGGVLSVTTEYVMRMFSVLVEGLGGRCEVVGCRGGVACCLAATEGDGVCESLHALQEGSVCCECGRGCKGAECGCD